MDGAACSTAWLVENSCASVRASAKHQLENRMCRLSGWNAGHSRQWNCRRQTHNFQVEVQKLQAGRSILSRIRIAGFIVACQRMQKGEFRVEFGHCLQYIDPIPHQVKLTFGEDFATRDNRSQLLRIDQ